ncbi:putative hexose carrier protein [Myxozyma melibiosi]|uniref:Hexose carrier protein n=1 Tax=Myxozyma melibiosi TaxID=54550 RepID=A0ABR1F852_9ASCO
MSTESPSAPESKDATVVQPEPAPDTRSHTGKPPSFAGLRGQNLLYAVTFCSSVGFLLFGYDLGFMGGLTTNTQFLNDFGNPGATFLGFIVASYEVGATFGALFQYLMADYLGGRKPANTMGLVIVIIGAIIQTTSFGIAQLIVGRIISGFGLGIATTVIPIWLAECTVPKSRGRMMAMQLSNLIIGLIISNWLVYGMTTNHTGSVQWRFPISFQVLLAGAVISFLPFLPESPRYLASVGKNEAANYALAALRDGWPDDEKIAYEIKEIEYAIAVESEEVGSWSDVFHDNGISGFTRVAIAFSANFFQQMSGVNVMSSLGPYVFEVSIGMSNHNAMLVSGGLQVYYFLSSLIPWWTVDRVGRRKLFMIGSAGMGTCMMLSAVFVGVNTKGTGYAAAAVLYIFHTFFTLGWQSNMWVYPSELLPLKLRLRGGALAVVSQWLFTFTVVMITPVMIDNIGYKSYIVFMIFNYVTIPIVYFFYPETSQRPLEVVDLLFADREGGRRPAIFEVVKDSVKKEFVRSIEDQLKENARFRYENEDVLAEAKEQVHHLEGAESNV